jgi:two-component system response regulator MprA
VAGSGSVLLVDDDRALREAVGRALRIEGYSVLLAADGREALDLLAANQIDLLILDLGMPVMGGIEVCRRVRVSGDRVSVLMLTARDSVSDRVTGLDAGADDYLVKPFALDELLARVRAGMRRREPSVPEPAEAELAFEDLRMDLERHRVHRGERLLQLTRTEYLLLEVLMRNPGRVLSRQLLFERIWGADLADSSKALDVYISYLRRKTEAGGEPRLVHTVRGVGYVLREEP